MRRGADLPGQTASSYIHVIWDVPSDDGGLPIESYELRLSDQDNSNTATIALNGAYLTSPTVSYYVFDFDGTPIVPGQPVQLQARACNSIGCADNFAPATALELSAYDAVPGLVPAPTLLDINATDIRLLLDAPAYTGCWHNATCVQTYEVQVETLPYSPPVVQTVLAEQASNLR